MRKISADIKKNDFAPVYLIFGDESYLRENYSKSLLKALVTPGDTLNYNAFSGEATDPKEVIALADTLPFMAERRVIYVKDSDFFKKAVEGIAEYIGNPSRNTVLIFDESNINKNNRAYKAAAKAGYVAEAERYDADKLPEWIAADFKRHGKKVTRETVNLLIERVGRDMTMLDTEVKKVSSYAEGRDTVTSEDVMTLVSRSPSYNVFQMIEAIGDRQLNKAVGIYYDMIMEGVDPYSVFSLVAKQFREMVIVSDMRARGLDNEAIAAALGLSSKMSWKVNKLARQAGKFGRSGMQRAIEDSVRAPREIAQGKIDKDIAMELLIISVASA